MYRYLYQVSKYRYIVVTWGRYILADLNFTIKLKMSLLVTTMI